MLGAYLLPSFLCSIIDLVTSLPGKTGRKFPGNFHLNVYGCGLDSIKVGRIESVT
jgi:hypothetical protein